MLLELVEEAESEIVKFFGKMEEADKWRIEKFLGQSFGMWKTQMEALLI